MIYVLLILLVFTPLGLSRLIRKFGLIQIAGGDGMPQLTKGKTYLLWKGSALPKRGQIILFDDQESEYTWFRRVIALPGEEVAIRDSRVYVNGKRLDEPYLVQDQEEIVDEEPVRIPPGHVFVLSDNRVNGYDSRKLGPIPVEKIIGKLLFVK
ncbi:signal peptidase I [Laceyella putida]|uniref:Signal peptidase I n=1 Tax=Laceyella putida TaxID=110101 RepID=A0ABW2RNU6_9BACL